MRILYIECNMGAAGDMLTAALAQLLPNKDELLERLNSAGIPNVKYSISESEKCGIKGLSVSVTVNGEEENEHMHEHNHHAHHHHSGINDIERIISGLNVSDTVKRNAAEVYRLIAEAESYVHGREISEIHFHEVGTADAVADVTAVCMLMEEIKPDKIIVSPINTGSGTVRCAHGILPVPAPATAYILRDIPIYAKSEQSELCTPTGAALLKHFADKFGDMPVMRVSKIGYGMGKKDFETANCVRAFLGETDDNKDKIAELRCNIDDMTGEAVGFAVNRLFAAGALDVFTAPIGMKKNRPGILLTCMCREQDREKMLQLMFKHTTTLGIREYLCDRYVLERSEKKVKSNYGEIRLKESKGWGVTRVKPEYDDLERTAIKNNISISDITLL